MRRAASDATPTAAEIKSLSRAFLFSRRLENFSALCEKALGADRRLRFRSRRRLEASGA